MGATQNLKHRKVQEKAETLQACVRSRCNIWQHLNHCQGAGHLLKIPTLSNATLPLSKVIV